MWIATWNVNSLKPRLDKVSWWLDRARPDVLLMQDTKLADSAAPVAEFRAAGYELAHHGGGQWNGVAIASRVGIADVVTNFGEPLRPASTSDVGDDEPVAEARIMAASCGGVRLGRQGAPRMMSVTSSIRLMLVAALLGCATGRNYTDPDGPRYVGGTAAPASTTTKNPTALRVVSFNIEYALRVDSAIAVLAGDPSLQDADVILLQEMDEKGTRRIADTLGMWYVYYPSVFRFKTGRDLGNAILSRWPIVEDRKIVLPHLSRLVNSQRAATAATIRVGETPVRVYSLHLGTMAGLSPAARRDQLEAVLADARRYPRVVLGGDLNDPGIGRVAGDMGYTWPTRRGPSTTPVGRLDHILFKGLESPDSAGAGTILDNRGASDHLPVWAVGILR